MILGLDIETTGLDQTNDRIIELCCRVYSVEGKLLGSSVARFNPCRPIDAKAQKVHGITIDQLYEKPKFEERAHQISKLLSSAKLIVIHNARFDAPFVANELRRANAPIPDVPVYDTMALSRWATSSGKFPKLGELCWALDVDYNPEKAHSAEYDVDVMMQCFFKIKQLNKLDGSVIPFNQIKGQTK